MRYPNEELADYYRCQAATPVQHRTGMLEGEGWLLYALVRCLRAGTVVELGTGSGCSGLWIAQALEDVGRLDGRMVSVDIQERAEAMGRFHKSGVGDRIETHVLDSHGPAGKALAVEVGKVSLILFDGDHTEEGVLADLETWVPCLANDSIAVFHDATRRGRLGLGVAKALAKYDASKESWEARAELGLSFPDGRGFDAGGPHDNGLVILQHHGG